LPSPLRREGDHGPRLPGREVSLLLSSSIGLEKAEACVTEAIGKLGFDASGLTRADALAILELVATQSGIIGVTARFAKSRVYLKWGE
jgi:hypothetical protein